MATAVVLSEHEGARPATSAVPSHRSRRVGTRRSFLAVVSGLVAFAALQLGLAVAVEIRLPELRDAVYARRLRFVQNSLRAEPIKPWTVMMMGSSRVQWGFRVGKGEENAWAESLGHPVAAFNFGVPGAASETELLTWDRLRRAGVPPNLLLVEVLPAYLAVPSRDYCAEFLPTSRLTWQDLPLIERYMGNTRTGLRREWLESWPTAGYTHRRNLIGLVAPDLLPSEDRLANHATVDDSDVRPWADPPLTFEKRVRATQVARGEYRLTLAGFRLGGPQCQALRELLASCRKERVPTAMVIMPEGPTFRSWYPPGTRETILGWLSQFSQEYDAPLINAQEWINDENDFMDSHHLLRSGRDKFMERLGRETIVPMLRRQPGEEKSPGALAAHSSHPDRR